MEQPYVLPILYCQCHACWCTGDFRSQCISRHGIDLQSRNIPSLASEELKYWEPKASAQDNTDHTSDNGYTIEEKHKSPEQVIIMITTRWSDPIQENNK